MKRYLLDFLEEVISQIRISPHVLLFIDYDGTLVPICEEPSLAKLPLEEKRLLKVLSGIPWLSVGIISGRSLEEVKKLVGVKGLFYAGNHGFEILFRGSIWLHPELERFKPALKRVAVELKRATEGINEILVEDKKVTVSIHYRKVTKKSPVSILKIISMVLEPYPEIFTITRGKKVYEVRPLISWDKGKAVVRLSRLLGFKSKSLTVYIGDDQTDEDAFRVLNEDDISIRVGYKRDSSARYFCKGSDEILHFLRQLIPLKELKKR